MLTNIINDIKVIVADGILLIKDIAGNDSMVSASLLLVATAVLSATFYFVTNRLPSIVWDTILRHFTTTLTIEYGDYDQRELYKNIVDYLEGLSTDGNIRAYSATSNWDSKSGTYYGTLAIGYGRHIIFFKHKLFIVDVTKLDSSGSNVEKKQCTVRSFGRNKKIFEKFIEVFQVNNDSIDKVNVFKLTASNTWELSTRFDTPTLSELALNNDTRDLINTNLNNFLNGSEIHKKLGIAYKTTMILHGIPGSGKTSLIRSIAKTYNRTLCIVPPTVVGITSAFNNLPENPLVVIEDFDSISSTKSRKTEKDSSQLNISLLDDDWASYGLSDILNALDGLISLDNVIVVLTTNVLDQIDEAITRKGRTDKIIELPRLTPDTVKDHLIKHYPELKNDPTVVYPDLAGCDIYDIKKTALNDYRIVKDKLKEILLSKYD